MKTKALVLPLALTLGAALSCDMNPTRAPTTGSISIVLLSPSGAAFSAIRNDATSDLVPVDRRASITLDGARVSVSGPTNKTVSSSTPAGGNFQLVVSDLAPGSYTVTVEGLASGQVAHFGQAAGITVTAGASTPASVSFPVFQPGIPVAGEDTSDVLRFTASWTPVSNATGYLVEWSQSATMTNPSSKSVTGATTTDIAVTSEGKYYYRVKAVNAAVASGGLASVPASVYVFQGVATVAVTPATPSVVAGGSQQMAAEARDADNNVVGNVSWFWASSNHMVATVSQSGLVSAIAPGTAIITAVGKGMPGSTTLTVTPAPIGPATRLAFSIQPTSVTAGQTMANVAVAVQTASGQLVTTDNATQVQIAIGNNAGGGTLSGTVLATAQGGIATFNNLSLNKSGTAYTLSATANALSGATSAAFNVGHDVAHHLSFSIQPTSSIAGEALSPAVQVEVRDQFDNVVSSSREPITVAIGTNPGGGTLAGTKVINAINGIASFSGIWIDKVGAAYTLSASSGSITGASSTTFNISPAAAARLAFSQQPPTEMEGNSAFTTQVRVTDAFGNVVPTATNPITVEIGRRAPFGVNARLFGTPTTAAVAGVATFNNLRVDLAGAGYTLNARSGSLQSAGSDEFRIRLTFTRVDAGSSHTCAVTVNSSAYCWGSNSSGQLGLGTFASDSVPRLVTGGLLFAQISAGGSHTCGLTTANALYCWGTNGNGELATGAFGGSFAEPQLIAAPANLTWSSVSAGGNHTCATSVVTATSALSGAYCWGWDGYGQLGIATATFASVNVATLVSGGLTFKRINAGDVVTCGIASTDLAYCWGYNGEGGLGVNDVVSPRTAPVQVNGAVAYAQAEAGQHSCFLRATTPFEVFCSGRNAEGQLGTGNNNPTQDETSITSQLTWTAISAYQFTTCLLDNAGLAYCMGRGTNGQLGNGAVTNQNVRQAVTGGRAFSGISVGGAHTCAVNATSGQIWCWGAQSVGRLGNGAAVSVSRSDPVQVIQ